MYFTTQIQLNSCTNSYSGWIYFSSTVYSLLRQIAAPSGFACTGRKGCNVSEYKPLE